MPPLIDFRRIRGDILKVLLGYEKQGSGGIRTSVFKSVLQALYPTLASADITGMIAVLRDFGLVELTSNENVPLEFQDMTTSVQLTPSGRAVARGDAVVPGVVVG